MRQREKEHLSAVDFELFSKNFDRLIAKAESELNLGKIVHGLQLRSFLISAPTACNGSVVLGSNSSVSAYNVILTHYGCEHVSSFRDPQIYPREIWLNTVAVRNDAATIRHAQTYLPSTMLTA
jgi:hypothetical protein